uniref:ILP7 n=1 Tax=Blattella germanica TaxID=6973 RepID=A0A445MQH7_BLAGE|nr:ILP7 [Blattella germanica]
MLKCGIVTALVLVTTMVSGAPTIRMQMCGSQLANTLAQICSAYGYHDPFSQTRRVNSPSSGVNTTPNRLRVRRGVADECCKTGCTLDTMEQYCSAPLTPAQR